MDVREEGSQVLGDHMYQKQGRPGQGICTYGVCLRSEWGRRGTPSRLGQTWWPASKGPGQGGGR